MKFLDDVKCSRCGKKRYQHYTKGYLCAVKGNLTSHNPVTFCISKKQKEEIFIIIDRIASNTKEEVESYVA